VTDSDRRREQGAPFADGGLPPALRPTTHETLRGARGDVVEVPKARLVFRRWTGALPGDRCGAKPILDWHGEPVFAELAILRILEAHGWGGVWVDSFGCKYRVVRSFLRFFSDVRPYPGNLPSKRTVPDTF
jgi:hypothetical protein